MSIIKFPGPPAEGEHEGGGLRLAEKTLEDKIKPVRGVQAALLAVISELACILIRQIELERSGIRDGDGCWHDRDPDPLDSTVQGIVERWAKFKAGPNSDDEEFDRLMDGVFDLTE